MPINHARCLKYLPTVALILLLEFESIQDQIFPLTFFFPCIRHLLPSAHADDASGLERWDCEDLDPKMAGKREAGGLFLADRYKWSDMEPPKKKDPNKRANNALVY